MLLDPPMMREILADVGAMRSALELELWASWILGQTWKQRTRQPQFTEIDWMLAVGAPMVAMIAEIGGARARKALTAISLLEPGALGHYAGAIALGLPGARRARWMTDMAAARFTTARHACAPDEGEAILLDLQRGGAHELSVAAFIDARGGGAVKWIRLLGPVPAALDAGTQDEADADAEAETVAGADAGADLAWMEPVDLMSVAARLRAAIAVNDRDVDVPVLAGFADLRAFLLARLPAVDA